MKRLRATLVIAAGAAFLGIAGAALALTVGDQPSSDPATVVSDLARGPVPSGGSYTVSKTDAEVDGAALCYQISTAAGNAQGCQARADANGNYNGHPLRPGLALLGTDRFVSILAPDGIAAMRVTGVDGGASAATARSVDVEGVGRLLVATYGGPPVTSASPEPARTVELLDAQGQVVRTLTLPEIGKD